jgi:paraquat-inducible protein A
LKRPKSKLKAERIACPDCGVLQLLPALDRGHVAECHRCGKVLAGAATGRVDAPLAWAMAAMLLFIPACIAPLMTVTAVGAHRQSWIFMGVSALWNDHFRALAALVAVFSILLPFTFLAALIWVLGSLHYRSGGPIGSVFRWLKHLRPWMMLEVYLIGCFVAYSRIEAIARVDIGVGGWCLLASTFVLMIALTQLDERTVWEALPRNSPEPARGVPTIACTICDLIVPRADHGTDCPRCGATLHDRKPASVQRTVALLIAGFLLYIPANLLPVLTVVRFGREERNTILSGVNELIHNNLWPLAVIVFVASIVLPLMKLCGLTWMLIATRRGSDRLLVMRTRLYRMIDAIGRWSNIDVFMASVLVAVLQFGALTAVRINNGMVAFGAVVVITMIATAVFDTRLMWDSAERAHGRAA